MPHKNTKEVVLIFLALIGQLFASMNMSFTNSYLEETKELSDIFLASNKLVFTYWMLLTILGRICGAYFFGKHADRVGILKSILSVSRNFVLLTLLCAVFCFTHEFSHEMDTGFYIIRLFYCFLEPAALILPSLYLLNRSPENQYKLSALLIGAVFVAKSASYHLIYLPPALMKFWYLVPLITTSLSWAIYCHLEKHSESEKAPASNSLPMPFQKKVLNSLFGAACATGAFYHHFFVDYYSVNINIVDARFDLGSVMYYTLCGLFLFPAAKLCERFGLYKTARISLGMLFLLGMNSILASPTSTVYAVQQLLFSFFSALFIAPMMVVLHRLYKKYSSFSDTMFWFMLGFSLCTVLAFFEQQLGLQKGFKGIGWCVYSASIFLCLIAIYKFRTDTILGARSKADSIGDVKLFEA